MNTTTNIIVIGQLSIRIINGRNGPFRVGTLQTGIGKFAVKDLEVVHKTKLPESGTEIMVTRDLATGDVVVDIG